jgi:hypothetical protein
MSDEEGGGRKALLAAGLVVALGALATTPEQRARARRRVDPFAKASFVAAMLLLLWVLTY